MPIATKTDEGASTPPNGGAASSPHDVRQGHHHEQHRRPPDQQGGPPDRLAPWRNRTAFATPSTSPSVTCTAPNRQGEHEQRDRRLRPSIHSGSMPTPVPDVAEPSPEQYAERDVATVARKRSASHGHQRRRPPAEPRDGHQPGATTVARVADMRPTKAGKANARTGSGRSCRSGAPTSDDEGLEARASRRLTHATGASAPTAPPASATRRSPGQAGPRAPGARLAAPRRVLGAPIPDRSRGDRSGPRPERLRLGDPIARTSAAPPRAGRRSSELGEPGGGLAMDVAIPAPPRRAAPPAVRTGRRSGPAG